MAAAKQDLIAAIIFTALGLIVAFVLIPFGVVEPAKVKFAALAPSYYPRIVALVLALTGCLLVYQCLRRRKSSGDAWQGAAGASLSIWRLSLMAVILGLYFGLLEQLGFVLMSMAAMGSLLWFKGERKIPRLLILTAAVPFALYYFFVKAAGIPIPAGILEPLLAGL